MEGDEVLVPYERSGISSPCTPLPKMRAQWQHAEAHMGPQGILAATPPPSGSMLVSTRPGTPHSPMVVFPGHPWMQPDLSPTRSPQAQGRELECMLLQAMPDHYDD